MKYIFTISGDRVTCISSTSDYDSLVTQDTFPAREDREGYKAVLAHGEQGIYWNYIALTPAEKRETAYNSEKCIIYSGSALTIDEANDLWKKYQAEGSPKAAELTALIVAEKMAIRSTYPDE